MRLLAVLNPSSHDFEARRRWPRLASALSQGADLVSLETSPDAAETSARIAAAASGCHRVVAIGGDGTVHLVVNALLGAARKDLPELAVIPFGTANDVGKSLGLPLGDLEALAAIARGPALQPLDVGHVAARCDGQTRSCYFLDAVTIGMDADVLATRAHYRPLGGYLAYAAALAERSLQQRGLDVRLDVDDRRIDDRVFNIIINNVPIYAGEIRLPGARLDDGLLDVYLLDRREYASKVISLAIQHADLLQLGISDLLEDITQNQRAYHGKRLRLRLASPRAIQVDGEVLGETDEVEATLGGRLRVAAPR